VFIITGVSIFITMIVDFWVDIYVISTFAVELYAQRNIVTVMAHGHSLYCYKLRVTWCHHLS